MLKQRFEIIRAYLLHGDMKKIAKLAEYSESYVYACFQGKRQNLKVLKAALKVAKFNKELMSVEV